LSSLQTASVDIKNVQQKDDDIDEKEKEKRTKALGKDQSVVRFHFESEFLLHRIRRTRNAFFLNTFVFRDPEHL